MRTPGEDFFSVHFIKLADCGSVPFELVIPAKGYKNLAALDPPVPETFNAQTLPFRNVQRHDAKMIITAAGDAFCLYDSYANPVKTERGVITLPLDGSG